MRAIVIRTFGDPDGMQPVEVPEPTAASGELVIDTEAIGVGGVDAVIRRGTIGGAGFTEGLIPGSEVAGVVSAVGDGVDAGWLGRRVWGFTGTSGGYTERALARVENVVALPEGLSPTEAVAIGSAAPVAHFALAHGRLVSGERVLIRGAAGSIGIAAVELAARAGASAVAVTTSSAERGERLRELGATHVLDRDGAESEAISPSPSDGFDVILDIVAGPATGRFIERLASNGRMVIVGAIAGFPPADFGAALLRGFQRSRSVATFSLDTVPRPELARVRAAQFEAVVRGDLHAVVHDILPLEAAADAHRRMDAGEVFGRIVLAPAPTSEAPSSLGK
ncbi:zinc-binding dehydrogenase [Leifsonia sp. NPDC058292]|uniref:zinc-binding dehydrogenase n=1 Tax=Leifsonia sp. NPDC058292 TaxID=3346428 RepID=UPI0036D7C572